MADVRIPPTLRAEVGGARQLEARGETVADVLHDLVTRHPALGAQLLEDGELAPFVNVFVDGEDIRTLAGRLLLFDALGTTLDEVIVRRDPDCPVCGESPTITEYVDYVEFCNATSLN